MFCSGLKNLFNEKSKKLYKLGFKEDFKYFIKIAIPIVSII